MPLYDVTVYCRCSVQAQIRAASEFDALEEAKSMTLEELGVDFPDFDTVSGIYDFERDGDYAVEWADR